MFESLGWFALLLLAIPWVWWSRTRSPQAWPVGGFEPFRDLEGKAGARRAWPVSLILGLLALVCATVALAGPRHAPAKTLIVLDMSLSSQNDRLLRYQWPMNGDELEDFVPGGRAAAEVRIVPADWDGFGTFAADETDIFETIRLHDTAGPLMVFTDRPRPLGTPRRVDWRASEEPVTANCAILNAWRDPQSGRWSVEWDRWGDLGPLELVLSVAGQREAVNIPVDEPGVIELPYDRVSWLTIKGPEGRPDRWTQDEWTDLDHALPYVSLPDDADARWKPAVAALFGADCLDAAPEDISLEIRFGKPQPREPKDDDSYIDRLIQLGEAAVVWFEADPFAGQDEDAAVAVILERLQPFTRDPQLPRPVAECRPDPTPRQWPAGLLRDEPVQTGSLSRAFAAVGGLLYLVSLLLRRRGL